MSRSAIGSAGSGSLTALIVSSIGRPPPPGFCVFSLDAGRYRSQVSKSPTRPYPPFFIPEHFNCGNYAAVSDSKRSLDLFHHLPYRSPVLRPSVRAAVGVCAACYASPHARGTGAVRDPGSRASTPGLVLCSFRYVSPVSSGLGVLGTLLAQIIIHLVVTVPIVIWIMIGLISKPPRGARRVRGR